MMNACNRRDRVALIDDHPCVTDALKVALMLNGKFTDVLSARNLLEAGPAISACPEHWIVVLDLHLKDTSGADTLCCFREQFPFVPFVVFSGEDQTSMITQAYELGAKAFVSKNHPVSEIVTAIQKASEGKNHVPDSYEMILDPRAHHVGDVQPLLNLTERQHAVLEQLLIGVPNKVIAARLEIAEGTVKAHLNAIYSALRARNRVEAILRARALGLAH